MKLRIELGAVQVLALYEVLEHCGSVIALAHQGVEAQMEVPKSFAIVQGMQSMLEVENVDGLSAIDLAAKELEGKGKMWSVLPELNPATNVQLVWLAPREDGGESLGI